MNIEFQLPALGENVVSGDVVSVLVREGDVIAANDGVVEIETDKAVLEITCPHAGKITKVLMAKGQNVKVGQAVLNIETVEEEAAKIEPVAAPAKPQAAAAEDQSEAVESRETSAGPEARRLARELGVNLSLINGTGKHGRITVEDVRAAAVQAEIVAEEAAAKLAETPAVGIPAQRGSREPAVPPGVLGEDAYGPVRREPMSRIRRTIATQMAKSAGTTPHVTNFDDADVTELERMRKTIPPAYLGPMIKLTAMPFVLKAVALGLRQHPLLNSSLDEEKGEIVYKQYIHLGVAVDTPRGLVAPVIRNIDRLGVVDIARELTLLAARTRAADFTVEHLRGGTFTVSNLGAIGGVYSTPIINHPEVAILLLGRSRWLLGIHEGKIEGRLKMPLSLSYDHRVVDGAAATRFLNDVIDYLQSPGKLLLAK
jgi:pyruvate dehydrogenase E2 component (dihydrolipoamide acetyltransferase)